MASSAITRKTNCGFNSIPSRFRISKCFNVRVFNFPYCRIELIELCIDIADGVRNGITNTDHTRLEVGDVGADCDAEICGTH